jgi:WD40 repeat protein/tRNA A-37 threonylcarbamoyl transferase component Bud32
MIYEDRRCAPHLIRKDGASKHIGHFRMEQTRADQAAPNKSGGTAADRYRRLMEIFEQASELRGVEREWFLSVRCAEDAPLRAEVEAMLRSSELDEAPIATGAGLSPALAAGDAVATSPPLSRDFAPVAVLQGHYRIIRAIAEGGMGVVYEAEQTIPRRSVAIKAIRPGMSGRQMLRRFEREAHILGRLQHPGIAQIFEAGAATAEQADEAYFVMEFVDGRSITDYATQAGLEVDARLELFAKVCDAVQHAHQRRVIHRDLKPGNILVTGEGQPKILDFGVARLDSAEEQGVTRHTQAGALVGTVSYMAPEQLLGEEVDVRADVYSLGVVLYQLLADRLPHDLTGKSLPEAARIISQDEPARIASIRPELRGDIDTVVHKAMERDRDRRYQSAADLAADIRRQLRGEPILARGDSAVYVLRKQIARHRTLAVGAVLAVLALAGFAVYAQMQSTKEAAAKRRVETALIDAQEQRKRADANAEHYRAELATNNIERGRLLGMAANFPLAEQLIWKEHLTEPNDLSYWAMWELYSRMPVRASLTGHSDWVMAVAASADGSLAATAGDTTIRLWNTRDWSCQRVIKAEGGQSRGLWFSPDSRLVLGVWNDGAIGVWNAGTGVPVQQTSAQEPIYGAAGPRQGPGPWPVAVRTASGIRMYAVDESGIVEKGRLGPDQLPGITDWTPIAMSEDRRLVAAGYFDGSTRVFDVGSGGEVWSAKEHGAQVTGLAFSPDSSMLVTGAYDRWMLFWNVSGTTITPASPHSMRWDNGAVRCLSFSRDGKYIVGTGHWRVEVVDVEARAPAKGFTRCEENSRATVWLTGDQQILASGTTNGARVWDAHPNAELRLVKAHNDVVCGLAISPKGDVVASSANNGGVKLWSWPSMEPVGALTGHTSRVRAIAFSNDGRRLVTGSADRTLRVWDVETRACTLTVPNSPYEYFTAAFSPDDKRILTGIRDQTLRAYDAQTGVLSSSLDGNPTNDGVMSVLYAGDGSFVWMHGRGLSTWDGKTESDMSMEASGWAMIPLPDAGEVAVGCWGGSVDLWNVRTLTHKRTLKGHTQIATSLAVGPALSDGSRALASCSAEGLIKLWNTNTGACLLTLNPDAGQIFRLVASADGRWIVSGHEDGTLGVWDLSYYDAHIKAAAEARAATKPPG